MKSKLLWSVCALLCFGVGLQSCDDDDDNNKNDQPQIAVLLKSQTNDWRKALWYNADKALKELDVNYILKSAANGTEQATQLKDAVDSGVSVVVLSPEGISATAVNEAIAKGVKVVLMEEKIVDGYTSYVSTDNAQVGENAATWVSGKDVDKVAVLSIEQDPASSDARVEAFKDKLAASKPAAEVVDFSAAMYTKDAGKTATLALLADTPDVDAIYAQDDDVALGVLEALEAIAGNNVSVVVGCGGSQAFFNLIGSSEEVELATTLYSPTMITKCIEFAGQVLKGQTPTKDYAMPATLVDKSNYSQYIDANSPY